MESTPEDPSVDAFRQLQSLLITLADVDTFLQSLAELAAGVVDPPASCGINTHFDGRPLTVNSSDHRASKLDHTQFDLGDGPCLQAMQTGQSIYVSDVAAEQRWEPFMNAARDEGVRSSLSLPLTIRGTTVGAMNFFAFHAAHAFDAEQQQRCAIFAAQAAGTLQLASRHLTDTRLLEQLEEALSSRTVIDQAMGILIAQQRCTADTAFGALRHWSTRSNQKLRDVAADIVQRTSGQAPTAAKPFQTHREPPTQEA
ncbi:MAG: GAF and ANTAR domain-containing protein [Janthinobacterium lividum]